MLDRLAPRPGARQKHRRPRGTGCGFGKTAGRGTKGQGKRKGGRETPAYFEGGQMPLVRRIPKRGFRPRGRVEAEIINVGALAVFGAGATVDPVVLAKRGLIPGSGVPVKLLAEGDAPGKLTVKVHRASAAAKSKIEAAGGSVEILGLSSGFQNIGRVPELQKRILFTFAMLAVYRLGCHIVTPGINPEVIKAFFAQMGGSVFGLFNLFSGGALQQLSIFALGIMPYISSSIIFQLLTIVVPSLEQLQKEGESGRRKITQWTRYATVVIALFQSTLLAIALENGQFGEGAVLQPGWSFRILMAITLTTGTAFIMWLGEQITERGIGNGISLVIFAGIVVGIPRGLYALWQQVSTDQFTLIGAILLLGFASAFVGVVVLCERAQRRIPIQHARRVVGRKVMQGGMSYFPLRLNTAGVIPPIFASSILMFPLTIAQFVKSETISNFFTDYLHYGSLLYNAVYVGLIVFFAFFYTAIVINPDDVADNIKRSGAYIPGIRPGKRTAEYIDRILGRLTLLGALYVSVICVLPAVLSQKWGVPFYFGGTALLIVVGVALDTIGQIEAHLVSRQYEGFVKGTRIRGRLGR